MIKFLLCFRVELLFLMNLALIASKSDTTETYSKDISMICINSEFELNNNKRNEVLYKTDTCEYCNVKSVVKDGCNVRKQNSVSINFIDFPSISKINVTLILLNNTDTVHCTILIKCQKSNEIQCRHNFAKKNCVNIENRTVSFKTSDIISLIKPNSSIQISWKSKDSSPPISTTTVSKQNKSYNKNTFTYWMIFPILTLSITIIVLLAHKKGYLSKFDRSSLNKRWMPIKARLMINGNDKINRNSPDFIISHHGTTSNETDSDIRIINEFKRLCSNSKLQEEKYNLTKTIGGLPINKDKNRFINILPFDQVRVRLQRTISESDYINASFIPFFDNPNRTEYIAAQGPLNTTVTDFWWMVWEQNVSVIVMLTKIYEEDRKKCEKYWPSTLDNDEEFEENLDFSLALIEENEYTSYTERKLKLVNKITTKWRNIIHLHMHSWDDYSTPNLEEFEKALYRFREITSSNNSPPYVIHCSAGVGRTGTFITIDRIMKKVLSGKTFVNIYEEVLELRKHRSFMVQQKSQYIFIHKFVSYFMKKYHDKDVDCEIEENIYEFNS